MLKATVSGSFHRHMAPIYEAVGSLREAGVHVLSPSDPRVVDHIGDFLFVASDKLRSIKLVQDRHLAAIRASDFLWVVCPDGYTGASTSMEIGAAHNAGVPIYSVSPALDSTIGAYVRCVPSLEHMIQHAKTDRSAAPAGTTHILIDPSAAAASMHEVVDLAHSQLIGMHGNGRCDAENAISRMTRVLRGTLTGLE